MTKQNMNNSTLTNSPAHIGNTIFHQWPNFRVSGIPVDVPERLHRLLTSSETDAIRWRAAIPAEVIKSLLIFPQSLFSQLICVAQHDSSKFIDWAKFCPALIVLAIQPDRLDKTIELEDAVHMMRSGWRILLKKRGWSATRTTLRILQKMAPSSATHALLSHLRYHLEDRRKARLISHLSLVDATTIDTLHLSSHILSVRLLEVATHQSDIIQAPSVRELCEELMQYRKEVGLYPLWPYRHGQISEKTLFDAEQLIIMQRNMDKLSTKMAFPSPPIDEFKSSKLVISPIRRPRELYHEGIQMQNCLPGYAAQIVCGSHFAYRVIHPERATLLLFRSARGWRPWQLKTIKNGTPGSQTRQLVEAWAGAKFPEKEVEHAPF